MNKWLGIVIICFAGIGAKAQIISGKVENKNTGEPLAGATISAAGKHALSRRDGKFSINQNGSNYLIITMAGYKPDTVSISAISSGLIVSMQAQGQLEDVVITGTMKAVQKSASPVPVEVYTPQFFRRNPTPTIFDALQLVNGVRPQLNCNVCNTGDIHINGLEGPYTMVLIDGMPIVSSLASVYGLSGIPNSLVERIEVVKGPASSLYGSEAIGGLINVITKNPAKAPLLAADISSTSWGEYSLDAGLKYKPFKKTNALLGVNYFNFSNRYDRNKDNFTDVTLQNRISVFNKYQFERKNNRQFNVAGRYIYEDRWGGDMRWSKEFRGGDSLYGESIYTARYELIGNYQLPVKENLLFSWSYNNHSQRSVYGTSRYDASQRVAFGQLTWDKAIGKHDLLTGAVFRYTFYDDNTTATLDTSALVNHPERTALPGVFVQDEIALNAQQKLLLGARWDYHPVHKHIFTPRIAWKYSATSNDIIRVNAGTGFRVVNLFTEDHAALTGARAVVIGEELKPERSYNANINYVKKIYSQSFWINLDASIWYTHFSNRILPDYNSDPNQILYDNLRGYSVSKGFSMNTEFGFTNSLRGHMGITIQDVTITEKDTDGKKARSRQLLTEPWSGTWSLSYSFFNAGITLDYTGNMYGPMLLPLISKTDPRDAESPVWSIQNIQVTKKWKNGMEVYAGVKNFLNWTPAKHAPFLIARSNDPFDKQVQFDGNGQVIATPGNPYALTFDPNYVYAPNQGIRGFLGMRLTIAR